jgi:hypothetical protein
MEMKKILALGVILLFIGVAVAPSINQSVVKAFDDSGLVNDGKAYLVKRTPFWSPFITYPSLISIEIDPESLNQTFIPDDAYLIRGFIGYKVVVPCWLLESNFNICRLLKTWYLFGSFVVYPIMIHMSAENVPTWADIVFLTPDIYIGDYSNEFVTSHFDVVVVIHNQAPPGPFIFSLYAEAPQVHRIQGVTCHVSIIITVQ